MMGKVKTQICNCVARFHPVYCEFGLSSSDLTFDAGECGCRLLSLTVLRIRSSNLQLLLNVSETYNGVTPDHLLAYT